MSRRPKFKTKLDQELYVRLKDEFTTESQEIASNLQQTSDQTVANLEQIAAPTGTIVGFMGVNAPEGWLICNGNAISRVTYASLFNIVGVSHGYGDNSTTFNLPDLRGRFLRGFSGTSNNDPDKLTRISSQTGGSSGNSIGSLQSDSLQNITGTFAFTDDNSPTYIIRARNLSGAFTGSYITSLGLSMSGASVGSQEQQVNFSASNSPGARTSTETRPANLYANFIIKT